MKINNKPEVKIPPNPTVPIEAEKVFRSKRGFLQKMFDRPKKGDVISSVKFPESVTVKKDDVLVVTHLIEQTFVRYCSSCQSKLQVSKVRDKTSFYGDGVRQTLDRRAVVTLKCPKKGFFTPMHTTETWSTNDGRDWRKWGY